jgi:hypothetical protein
MAWRLVILMQCGLLACACATSDDPQFNHALADCSGEAQDAFESDPPPTDQAGGWQENYVRQCMAERGYENYR